MCNPLAHVMCGLAKLILPLTSAVIWIRWFLVVRHTGLVREWVAIWDLAVVQERFATRVSAFQPVGLLELSILVRSTSLRCKPGIFSPSSDDCLQFWA